MAQSTLQKLKNQWAAETRDEEKLAAHLVTVMKRRQPWKLHCDAYCQPSEWVRLRNSDAEMIMGLPVAGLSEEEKAVASGAAASLLIAASSNTKEKTGSHRSEDKNCSSSGAQEDHPTMGLSGNSNSEIAPQESTDPVQADANGSQIVSTDQDPREERSSTEICTVADFKHADSVLAEKPSPGVDDLGDANFITAVPVIQNLADVGEVMSVVANESEQELQPPDAKVRTETDAIAQQDNQVMTEGDIEAIEGGSEKNEPGKMEDDSDVKQEAATASIEGSTDQGNNSMVGADIESFLSGGDEKLELVEHGGENEPEAQAEGADYISLEEHQTLPISDRRKHKRLEVFVGGLDKETTEEDLSSVFKKVGDVVEVRLMKNPQTGKNKGYAFIRFASAALAKKAALEMERVQIRGRSCGVLPSEENDTLFLGNISKTWAKETVLDALKNLGIENIEDITLMEDPQLEGVNRGFAFIEFNTHKEALSAFRRLQQSDAIFGVDRSAKVAWAQPLNEPDEDTMSQVKSIFVDGMPPTWDEEKVKEHFSKFGEIERIVLARNMLSAKRKDFGFVNYVDRDAALACIEALNNTEINDGDIKMKVKVMLAKPQIKNKPVKGGTRGGYISSFRGDQRLGTGMEGGMGVGGRMGMGLGMGMGMGMGMGIPRGMELIPYDVLSSWGNVPSRFDKRLRFGSLRDHKFGMSNSQRPEKKPKRSGKQKNEEVDVKSQLLQSMKDKQTTNANANANANAEKKERTSDGTKLVQESPQNEDVIPVNLCDVGTNEQQISHVADVVSKPSLDKFECTMCGFGFDSVDEHELHKKTKVHKVIEGLRKDQKLNNKTPLSLLHEYASRHHCEVHYETEAETNGPFEVTAVIGGSIGGASGVPKKGFGIGRNKARAKQMAAANALEKIMENVSESEFFKPGQSKQQFGDRDRPNRKGKSGRNMGGGSGGSSGGRGNRNSRGRSNTDWRPMQGGLNNSFFKVPNLGGGTRGGNSKNKRYNTNDLFFRNNNNSSFISNPNAIPLNGYNEFSQVVAQRGLEERFGGRGGGGLNPSFQGPRGGVTPQNPETYAERYDRIQGGRGYGNPGFGGRDFVGGVAIGSESFNGRDLAESTFGNNNLPPPPPLLNFNTRDLPPIGFASANRDYEASGMKRPFLQMDEETRFVDAQRTLPRQRMEAPEQISLQSNANAQSFGVQPLFSEAQRSSVVRPQEQPQFNTYVQSPSQGLHLGHNIVQSSHIPSQHGNMSVAMVGVPTLNTPSGTPYSIYDAAPQTNPSLSSNGYANMNQDYMVNTSSISEMSQVNSYPTQPTYNAPYGSIQPTIPSQAVGSFTPIQNSVQQQSFY